MNVRSITAAALFLILALVLWHNRWDIENALHPHHEPVRLVAGQSLPHISAMPVGSTQLRAIGPAPGRFLYINVFATWCGPCRAETPALKRLSDETASGSMQIVGIDQLETDDAVNQFSRVFGLKYPMYVSRDSMTQSLLGVHYIPVTIIVDPAGVVRADVVGPMTYEQMHQLVQQVVGPRAFRAKG
jgi:thiol-disulfide isomerase/thioredoxin